MVPKRFGSGAFSFRNVVVIKVLVTGGRDYSRVDLLWHALDCVRPDVLVHGGAWGADAIAADWARMHGRISRRYLPDTSIDGPWPAAGPRRNRRMFDTERSGLTCVVRCPGGRGTQSMEDYARANGFQPTWTWQGIVFLTPTSTE